MMKPRTPPRLKHRTAGVDSSVFWEFEPGQRVMTREGITGIVASVEDGFVPGNEHYVVDLDHGLGGGQYHASELRAHRESTGAKTESDLHVASDDYPMLAEVLVDRPPLERTAKATSRREAAQQKTATLLRIVRTAMAAEEVAEVAQTLLQVAQQEEGPLTRLLNQVAEDRGGALEGLQYRFKDPDSLERKLWDRVNNRNIDNQRDLQASISDVLRYTMVFPSNIYSLQVRDSLYQVEQAGYPVIEEENFWGPGPYSALHYLLGTRSGLPVELQFHTLESHELKHKVLHKLYEEFREDRTPLPRKQELYDLMTSHWESFEVPDDVLHFPELQHSQRPANRRVAEDGGADPFDEGVEAPTRDLSTYDEEDMERGWEDETFTSEAGITDWLNDKLPERMQDRPFNQASFDWCRFRRDQRCYFPKQLHDRGTASEGFPVWVPEDRGFCPRHKWTEQRNCPVSEPGPNSSEGTFFPDATVPWEEGGQRSTDWANPHLDYIAPVTNPGVANPRLSAAANEFSMHYTAAWSDVQAKAARIRRSGGVRIISAPEKGSNQTDYIVAEVLGDSSVVYQTRLMRQPGRRATAMWECGCAWGHYAWGRSGRWKKFEGRMCAHALAVMYEAQSQEGFHGDGDLTEQPDLPLWRFEEDVPQTHYPAPERRDNWRVDASLHEGNWRPACSHPDYEHPPIMVIGAEVTRKGFRVRYRGKRREVLRVDPDTNEVLLDISGEERWVPTSEVQHPRFHPTLGLDPYDEGDYLPIEKGSSRTRLEKQASVVPAPPGEAPLPPGHVRLYHATSSRNLDSIRSQGLTLSNAQGATYGEPGLVWASAALDYWNDDHETDAILVEFSIALDDIVDRFDIVGSPNSANTPSPQSFMSRGGNIAFPFDIPSSAILNIHEGWHGAYRYLSESRTRADVLAGEYDYVTDIESYRKAIDFIKREGIKFSLLKTSAEGDSAMVAIRPPDSVLGELMATGSVTEEFDNLHVTMAYLPDVPDLDKLNECIAIFARKWSSFRANLQGYGTFLPDDGERVLYASVDGAGIEEMRTALKQHLAAWDFEVSDDHGFVPHLTLSYGDEPLPDTVPNDEFEVTDVIVANGDDWTHHGFGAVLAEAARGDYHEDPCEVCRRPGSREWTLDGRKLCNVCHAYEQRDLYDAQDAEYERVASEMQVSVPKGGLGTFYDEGYGDYATDRKLDGDLIERLSDSPDDLAEYAYGAADAAGTGMVPDSPQWHRAGLPEDGVETAEDLGLLDEYFQERDASKTGMAGIDPSADLAFNDRLGRCYELAGQYIMENPSSSLVHGSIQGAGAPRIGHAWVVDADGEVFDGTMGEHFPNVAAYAAFTNAEEVISYTAREAMHLMASQGHFGPWHDSPWGLGDHHDQQFAQDALSGRFAALDKTAVEWDELTLADVRFEVEDDSATWIAGRFNVVAYVDKLSHLPVARMGVTEFDGQGSHPAGWFISNTAVIEPLRRKGIATAMVEVAEARVGRVGFSEDDFTSDGAGWARSLGHEVTPDAGWHDGNMNAFIVGSKAASRTSMTHEEFTKGVMDRLRTLEEVNAAKDDGIADFERQENQTDPFDGVALKEDDDGWYVRTHRARSDSYPSPEDIPDGDIEFIRSTGAVKVAGDDTLSLCSVCWSMAQALTRTYVEGPVSGICDVCGNHSTELSVYASSQTQSIVTEEVEPALPQTLGDEESDAEAAPEDDYEVAGVDEDPVTTEGSREWLMSGESSSGGGPSNADIAAQAKKVLAAKVFTPEEQAELIGEGGDGLHEGARNLEDLDISGTHYQALEMALQKEDDEDDSILWELSF